MYTYKCKFLGLIHKPIFSVCTDVQILARVLGPALLHPGRLKPRDIHHVRETAGRVSLEYHQGNIDLTFSR